MPQGYANAPQPFQGQQNYAAPRYYGQVRARPPAVPPKNPPARETLAWHAHASQPGAFFVESRWSVSNTQRGIGVVVKIFLTYP